MLFEETGGEGVGVGVGVGEGDELVLGSVGPDGSGGGNVVGNTLSPSNTMLLDSLASLTPVSVTVTFPGFREFIFEYGINAVRT